jgi:hypothetical protein
VSEAHPEIAAALAPLGFRQRGLSAVWIADRGFWIAVAKFEAARVTVGAHWLWYVQSRWVFDAGTRIEGGPAEATPHRAAAEAARLGERFGSLAAIARELAAPATAFWPLYHAGVAHGLAGDPAAAANFFARLMELPARRQSEREILATASALAQELSDLASFRAAVAPIVERTRALQGLPAAPIAFA